MKMYFNVALNILFIYFFKFVENKTIDHSFLQRKIKLNAEKFPKLIFFFICIASCLISTSL